MQQEPIVRLEQALAQLPFVAILRGVEPDEVLSIGGALLERGVKIIEVPLNSPRPLESVNKLAEAYGEQALIGAGTVLSVEQVDAVLEAGGQCVISPHADPEVIQRTRALGMVSIPGFFTATEAFSAIRAGAQWLKWFPAQGIASSYLKALMAVLPESHPVLAVGGVTAVNLPEFWRAGARGYGIGGALYRAGDTPAQVATKAETLVEAWQTFRANNP